jgi:glyoxylase-like metal-dependent hydrolase (beta-lactamase superfamily II)
MLVDTSVTPAAARELVAGIRTLTDKPIRYVFNSHYHFDHAHGNQIFGDGVEIIGHEFVRERLLGNVLMQRTNRSFADAVPNQINGVRDELAVATDAAERAELQERIRVLEAHQEALGEVEPTPPNITYRDQMVIHKGGREVQLHFLGRGHTGGDTIVFLPEERIVFTGDFLVGRPGGGILSYMGDAYVDEWPDSLERLESLDFDVIVPGHGAPFRDRQQIADFQRYLRDLWTQVAELRTEGLSVQQAADRVDMSAYEPEYGPGARRVDPRAIMRLYELLQHQMAI